MQNPSSSRPPVWQPRHHSAIGLALVIVATLDCLTPVEYVMGYLYLCPILAATGRLPRRQILVLTILIVGLVLFDLLLPHHPSVG